MMKSLLLIIGLSIALFADYTLMIQTDDVQQSVQYQDDQHAVIHMSKDEDSRMMLIGDKAYIVSSEEGKETVMDMDEMRTMLGSLNINVEEEAKKVREELAMKVIKKGKSVTVAGIKGELWIIEYKERDGQVQRDDVVVTKNSDVVKVMSAYGRLLGRMAMSKDDEENMVNFMQIEPGYVVIKADQYKVTSFKEGDIPSSVFELPANAKKQSIPQFGALFGGEQQSSGQTDKKSVQTDDTEEQAADSKKEVSDSDESAFDADKAVEGVGEAMDAIMNLF